MTIKLLCVNLYIFACDYHTRYLYLFWYILSNNCFIALNSNYICLKNTLLSHCIPDLASVKFRTTVIPSCFVSFTALI